MQPVFLTLDEVLAIHQNQIERYGGEAGIRDMKLLLSAIAMPGIGIHDRYLHQDLCEMAAAYLYHIVRNHPFVDGNKRVGVVAADVFLALNGMDFRADEDKVYEMTVAVAEGKVSKAQLGAFIRESISP